MSDEYAASIATVLPPEPDAAPATFVTAKGEVLEVYKHPGGRFRPGNPWAFGPKRTPTGHPPGQRNKITSDFLGCLARDFEIHGSAAIRKMRQNKPADYCKMIASLLPKQLELKDEPFDGVSDHDLAAIVAAARGSLIAAEGSRGGAETEDGDQSAPRLPALS